MTFDIEKDLLKPNKKLILSNSNFYNFKLFIGKSLPEECIKNSYAIVKNEETPNRLYYCDNLSSKYTVCSKMERARKGCKPLYRDFCEIIEKYSKKEINKKELQVKISDFFIDSGIFNVGNYVNIQNFNAKKMIFSSNFVPCIAVIAKLKNGKNAIYHVENIINDTTNEFIGKIKKDVLEIIVIQKNKQRKNKFLSPFVALLFSNKIKNVSVKIIAVDRYETIICKDNKIIIVKDRDNIKYEDIPDLIKLQSLKKYDDAYNVKSIEESLIEAVGNLLKENEEINIEDSRIKLPIIKIHVTKKLMLSTWRYILENEDKINKNVTSFFNPEKIKNTITIKPTTPTKNIHKRHINTIEPTQNKNKKPRKKKKCNIM